VKVLGGADIEVEQSGEREVDLGHLVEADVLVDAPEVLEILLADGQWGGGPQHLPLVAAEGDVARRHGRRA
jgi:hypothetical protein